MTEEECWLLSWRMIDNSMHNNFAVSYDRIKVNAGEKQLYGTQFATVDPITKTAELQPTEDLDNLDDRRREMGMMPIQMYKRMMFEML
jgi:hypothetical protein